MMMTMMMMKMLMLLMMMIDDDDDDVDDVDSSGKRRMRRSKRKSKRKSKRRTLSMMITSKKLWPVRSAGADEAECDNLASQNLVCSDVDSANYYDFSQGVTSSGTLVKQLNASPFTSLATGSNTTASTTPSFASKGSHKVEQLFQQSSGSSSNDMLDLLKSKMAGQFPQEAAKAGVLSSGQMTTTKLFLQSSL